MLNIRKAMKKIRNNNLKLRGISIFVSNFVKQMYIEN